METESKNRSNRAPEKVRADNKDKSNRRSWIGGDNENSDDHVTSSALDQTDDRGDNLPHQVGFPPNDEVEFDEKTFLPVLKSNQYQVRKAAARSLMDVALMMANISQLRTIIDLGPQRTQHFYVLLVLITVSLVCQGIFAILVFVLLMRESEMARKRDYLDSLQMLESRGGIPKETTDKMKKKILEEEEDFKHNMKMSRLNFISLFLVFVTTVINMFITGFGIRDNK